MLDASTERKREDIEQKLVIFSDVEREQIRKFIDCAEIGSTITITPPRSTDEQTSRLHCAIRCIARQLTWAGEKLSEEDWKRLLVAAKYGQRVMPSPDGKGFVVLDIRTSRMSKAQKSDLIDEIYAWGTERGVVFDD